jgi:hypothetical protein
MLREWVLAGLGARSWGFDVEFLLLGFSGVLLLLLIFFFFFFLNFFLWWCHFCILSVCLGAHFTLFNAICLLPIKKKKKFQLFSVQSVVISCNQWREAV